MTEKFRYGTLIYDIESDGLLSANSKRGGSSVITKVDCLVIRDVTDPKNTKTYEFAYHEAGEYLAFGATKEEDTTVTLEARDDIEEGLWMLMTAENRIGHNIIDYDEKAIKMIYPLYEPIGRAIDTLVLTRLIMPDTSEIDNKLIPRGKLPGKFMRKHSLDAWGWRLGLHKGDYAIQCALRGIDPWKAWRPNKLSYCVNDIDVTEALWNKIQEGMPPLMSVEFEHECQLLATKQRENGVPFDAAEAEKLASSLNVELDKLVKVVKDKYGFWFVPDKKRVNRPVYDDPDIGDRETPLMRKRKSAKKKGLEFDGSDYDPKTGYQRLRPEFGEHEGRAMWGEVNESKATRRALEKHAAYVADAAKRAADNEKIKLWNQLNPDKPAKSLRKTVEKIPGFKWVKTEHGLVCQNPDTTEGALFCPMKRIDFNPGSRLQVVDRLIQVHNWQPQEFTETGQPQVNDAVLTKLKDTVPEAEGLAEIFFHKKILGALIEGSGSWLNNYNADTTCIHGNLNTGGTVSGRCAHDNPNLGNVVAVGMLDVRDKKGNANPKLLGPDGNLLSRCFNELGEEKKSVIGFGRDGDYGWECRSLFHVPRFINDVEWVQIGSDLVNIEGRTLGAALEPYDKGELMNFLVNGGDIHNYNMSMTGIKDRGLIKRVFFGLIYGAGDWKLGVTADPLLTYGQQIKLGSELRALIMGKIPALKSAVDQAQAEARGGRLIGLDGRRLQVRAEYAAFNLKLQSGAGLIAKKWWLLTENTLLDAGGIHGWPDDNGDGDFAMMLFVHDETQIAIKKYFAEEATVLIRKAANEAGEFFKFPCRIDADTKIGHHWAETH